MQRLGFYHHNSVFIFLTLISVLCLSGCSLIAMVAAPSETIRNIVVDEDGNPVSGVRVTNSWTDEESRDEGITDANGVVELTTTVLRGGLGASASKEGYYPSGGEVFLAGYTYPNLAAKEGWRLYSNPLYMRGGMHLIRPPEEIKIILKKITDPVPMFVGRVDWEDLPVLDEEVGFDMEVGDWVSPYGKGRMSDFIFKGKRRYVSRNDFEMEMDVYFSNPSDGIIRIEIPGNRYLQSQLRSPTEAPLDGYESKLHFERKASPGGPSPSWPPLHPLVIYVFRVRSEIDSEGRVTKARYGKVYNGIDYKIGGAATIRVYFDHYFNPTVNSRSLEYNGENLFKKTESTPSRYAP